jgi:hypothetical protein
LFFSQKLEGSRKMALKKVSILLILSIFGVTVRAWCDPVKSIHGTAIQLMTVKLDENKAPVLKTAKGSPEWLKKDQARPRDLNLLNPFEGKKKLSLMESLNKIIHSRELPENGWRNKFSNSLHAAETRSPRSDSEQSPLKAYPDENGLFEQAKTFTKLKLLQSREEIFKEIFMGVCFSFDLTNGHMLLEMNVTPSPEKRSGFSIRF